MGTQIRLGNECDATSKGPTKKTRQFQHFNSRQTDGQTDINREIWYKFKPESPEHVRYRNRNDEVLYIFIYNENKVRLTLNETSVCMFSLSKKLLYFTSLALEGGYIKLLGCMQHAKVVEVDSLCITPIDSKSISELTCLLIAFNLQVASILIFLVFYTSWHQNYRMGKFFKLLGFNKGGWMDIRDVKF